MRHVEEVWMGCVVRHVKEFRMDFMKEFRMDLIMEFELEFHIGLWVWVCMGLYGFVWVCMGLYGFVWNCVEWCGVDGM